MMAAWRKGEGDYFHEQGAYPQQLAHEGCAQVVAAVGGAVGLVAFSFLILPLGLAGNRSGQAL